MTGRAFSVHLGLNYVNPTNYGGWNGELAGCVPDSRNMAEMAERAGWQVNALWNDAECTNGALASKIAEMAGTLRRGDRFLLSYSGHGGQVPDRNKDEEDGRDETWCLHDGELIDDSLNAMLAQFRAGVRVVVISDSCHSGTVTRAPRVPTGRSSKPMVIRGLPEPEIGIVKASVLLFSGCTDDQLSGDLAEGGRFTITMLRELETLPAGAGWRTLEYQVRRKMPWQQRPGLYLSGKINERFLNERPFLT
jgi:hypothetical protein